MSLLSLQSIVSTQTSKFSQIFISEKIKCYGEIWWGKHKDAMKEEDESNWHWKCSQKSEKRRRCDERGEKLDSMAFSRRESYQGGHELAMEKGSQNWATILFAHFCNNPKDTDVSKYLKFIVMIFADCLRLNITIILCSALHVIFLLIPAPKLFIHPLSEWFGRMIFQFQSRFAIRNLHLCLGKWSPTIVLDSNPAILCLWHP